MPPQAIGAAREPLPPRGSWSHALCRSGRGGTVGLLIGLVAGLWLAVDAGRTGVAAPIGGLPPGSLPTGTPLLGRPIDRLPLNSLPHPAVVRVVAQERNAESHGSGTLIDVREDCGLVVTNWHVVRDAVGKIEVRFPGGFVSPARVRKADKVWDLAALVIWRPPVEPVRISRQPPRRGEPLTIAGYGPGPYRAVAGRCTQYVAPGVNYPPEMVELSAEARQGDSGGPIFNDQGELAGVLFGAARGTTTGSYGGRVREFLASIVTDPGAAPSGMTSSGTAVAGGSPSGRGNFAPATAGNPQALANAANGSTPNGLTANGSPSSFPPAAFPPAAFPPAAFVPPPDSPALPTPLASPASPPAGFAPIDRATPSGLAQRSAGAGSAAGVADPFGFGPAGTTPVAPAIALGQPLSDHAAPLASSTTPRGGVVDAPRFAPLTIPDPASHPVQLPPPPPEAVARQSSDFADFATGSNASISRQTPALPILPMPPPPRNAAEPALGSGGLGSGGLGSGGLGSGGLGSAGEGGYGSAATGGMGAGTESDDRTPWASSPFKLRESPGVEARPGLPASSPQTLEQWLALDGPPADQAKTVLALVGALALLSQAGRLFQGNEPAPKPKS
jgi:hypothetical protein